MKLPLILINLFLLFAAEAFSFKNINVQYFPHRTKALLVDVLVDRRKGIINLISRTAIAAARNNLTPISSSNCKLCGGKGAINCAPCNGKGIDRVNGSVLERWTCKKCKGFGYVSCSCNPVSGLTPEQR